MFIEVHQNKYHLGSSIGMNLRLDSRYIEIHWGEFPEVNTNHFHQSEWTLGILLKQKIIKSIKMNPLKYKSISSTKVNFGPHTQANGGQIG